MQPEQVVNQQEFANGNGYRKSAFTGFNGVRKLAQPHAFFEVFRLDKLVDIAHHWAALLIDIEHRMEDIFADVFARRRGKAHRTARQRMAEKEVQMFPVIEMQQQRVTALYVLLVDFHHQHVISDLFDVSAVVVQLHYAVRLTKIAV